MKKKNKEIREEGTSTHPPTVDNAKRQQAWDEPCCRKVAGELLERTSDDYTRARLLPNQQETSGAWLEALPITSVGLRMADDVIRVAVGVRLGANLCDPHVCVCGHQVDARGTHGMPKEGWKAEWDHGGSLANW